MGSPSAKPGPRVVGRYALYGKIASGGMATVSFGRLLGPVGFSRTVAVKRLHPHFTEDPEFVTMFLDEARLAARIRHPNVVPTLDVVATEGELFLVMEYVQGETLSRLLRVTSGKGERIPLPITLGIFSGVLHGLHAAHEAKDEQGAPLGIVHRDVSPQNVIVGVDGGARVLDFGVAKAAGRLQTTREGQLKGKLAYMAPEQLEAGIASRQTDVYAASVVLWESLTGKRLFQEEFEASLLQKILTGNVQPPSQLAPGLPEALDAIVLSGLDRDPKKRFATAKEMASALEQLPMAIPPAIGAWVEQTAAEALAKQAAHIAEIESDVSGAASVDDAIPEIEADGTVTTARAPGEDDATVAMAHAPHEEADATIASQMSSISVATPATPVSPLWDRRMAFPLLGAGALGVLGIIALLVSVSRGRAVDVTPVAPASPALTATASAAQTVAAPATVLPEEPAASAQVVPEPSAAPAPPPARAPAPVVSPSASRPAPPARPVTPPASTPPKRTPAAKPKGGVIFNDPG